MHAVVIGAGVVGVTTAWQLVEAGHRVTLIERGREVAGETSFANGAQLSWSYVEPMARPSMLTTLPSVMLGRDPTFAVRRHFDPGLFAWWLRFLGQCSERRFLDNAAAAFALAAQSRQLLHALLAREPIAFDHARPGKLVLYPDARGLEQAARTLQLRKACGIDAEVLGRDACIAHEPVLSRYPDAFAGGLFAPGDEVGDPAAFARGLLGRIGGQSGFDAIFDCAVRRLVVNGGKVARLETDRDPLDGDAYILCAGPWSGALARTAGLSLPIYPVRGYSLTLPAGPGAPGVSVTDMRRRLVFCRLGDRLRVAGFAEFAGFDARVDPERLALLARLAGEAMPSAGDFANPAESWAGLRPMTPNGLPIVGRTRVPNLLLNVGHGAFGWTWACATAHRTVELLPTA